jgi:hypothetical protein
MKYIQIKEDMFGNKIFGRVDDDGLIRVTCSEDNPDYQAYLKSLEDNEE